MKLFALCFIVAFASGRSLELEKDELLNLVSRTTRATINENLVNMIEILRDKMYTGDDELGLPIMDPLNIDSIPYTIDESLALSSVLTTRWNEELGLPLMDPFVINGIWYTIDESLASLDGSLETLNVGGLAGFTIDNIRFSLAGIKFTFGFTWPSIQVSTKYAVDGTVASVIPLYGNGDLDIELTNLTISGGAALSTRNSTLYVHSLTTAISLEALDFEVTGLLNADDVSALVSAVVTDMAPQVIEDYQEEITGLLNERIIALANGKLGSMTLSDLLDIIRG